MKSKLNRRFILNIIYVISVGILILLLAIQNIKLSNYVTSTRNYMLEELQRINEKADLTDIEKEINKLEERIIDLENGG